MIGQVINITGLQLSSLMASEAELVPKLLPAENSVVEVSVLEKSNGNYKLLIEGNVFQAKLPVSVNAGETLIAKVTGLNPFTLSLDRIFSAKMLNESSIALVLSKLGITETEISSKVLKAFLKEEKPVVKSKLKKIIELLEKEDIKLDEQQLSLFIQMILTGDSRGSFLNKSFAKLFQYPVETLAEDILSSVKRLNSMGLPDGVISRINRALVLEMPQSEKLSAIELKEKSSARIEDLLSESGEMEILSENIKQELAGLKETLVRFNMLRACYARTGVYPGFIIIKSGDELEMAGYRLEDDMNEAGQKSYKIKLEMNPALLGKVTINGFLSGRNLNAAFRASEEAAGKLDLNKEELLTSLGRLNVLPRLSFGNAGRTVEVPDGIVRQVNVRV